MNVYNTETISDVTPGFYYNNGTKWVKVADDVSLNHNNSIETTGDITTSSTTDVAISDMTLSPPAGTYTVLFNGQYSSTGEQTSSFSTSQGISDLGSIYNQLIGIPVTNTTHAGIFGNGEVLAAGVYSVSGAISVQGTLTLDGGGNPNALFIIRAISSALSTVAGATIILTNGATANNVFWIAGGAIGLGASTVMKGTLLAFPGAVSAAASSTLQGRMFSSAGTIIAFDNGTASIPSPSTSSYVNLKSLLNFVIFSGGGALSNAGTSTFTGDIATDAGAITGFGSPTIVNGTIFPPGASSVSTTTKAIASFSIYKNNILLPNSTRTSSSNNAQISLQSVVTVLASDSINIRWKINAGPLTMGNRILTLTNVK